MIAGSLEQQSEHPLSDCGRGKKSTAGLRNATRFYSPSGKGVWAKFGQLYLVGNRRLPIMPFPVNRRRSLLATVGVKRPKPLSW